jgi:hypothetical protein
MYIYTYIYIFIGEVTERRRRASFDESASVPSSSSAVAVAAVTGIIDGDKVRADADLLTNDAWRGMGFSSTAAPTPAPASRYIYKCI